MNNHIDLVYLWVDGSDPIWLAKKEQYLHQTDQQEHQLAIPERWQDNHELRFSLRSVEQFAPWIHHIFLVTDGQCPSWLKPNHPKLTLVDHHDFIPENYLPLFNSEAIETFLPLIPGLSEHFLFANDDMFLGRNISPNRFFDIKGNPLVQVKKLYAKDFCQDAELTANLLKGSRYASRVKANVLVSKLFGQPLNWEAGHVIDPCRKSFMLEALEEPAFAEAWENTRRHRFRSPEDVQRILFPLYDACKCRTRLLNISRFKEWKRLFCPWRIPYYLCNVSDWQKVLRIRPEMFCYYVGDYYDNLLQFFNAYYPVKSSFEK